MANGSISMGVCYGPYHQQKNKPRSSYTEADVLADMAIIAKNFSKIRTYSMHDADVYNVAAASKYGLKVGLGTWIFKGKEKETKDEIYRAMQQAEEFPNTVLHFVVGNEVDLNYDPEEVEDAFIYARTTKDSIPKLKQIPITICFSGRVLDPDDPAKASKWSNLVNLCQDIVYLTVYPWFGKSPPDNIDSNMRWSYDHGMKQVEDLKKRVIIAEIGWPSAGGPGTLPPTTVANEQTNFSVTNRWVSGNNFLKKPYETFWFEMFDEPWKTEHNWEPYWGLYGSGMSPTPKFTIPTP